MNFSCKAWLVQPFVERLMAAAEAKRLLSQALSDITPATLVAWRKQQKRGGLAKPRAELVRLLGLAWHEHVQ